jgi:ferrous iron transport protein B
MNFLLTGNPNSGKTTLFNSLTGLDERVSNYSGVTVSLKSGKYKNDKTVSFTDIPGVYSLSAISSDEVEAKKAILGLKTDGIIVVVDGTKLERSLHLVVELLSLNKPVTVAINFYDDLLKNGIKIDCKALSLALGVPVVNISGKTYHNVDLLIKTALHNDKLPSPIKDKNIADFIKRVVDGCVNYKKTKAEVLSAKLDKILLGKFGFAIFILLILTMFFVADKVGGFISKYLDVLFGLSIDAIKKLLATKLNLHIFADFIADGKFQAISALPLLS